MNKSVRSRKVVDALSSAQPVVSKKISMSRLPVLLNIAVQWTFYHGNFHCFDTIFGWQEQQQVCRKDVMVKILSHASDLFLITINMLPLIAHFIVSLLLLSLISSN